MLLTLHRLNVVPSGSEHVFIFSLENVPKLASEPKGVESEGFNYGGTDWSLVCARKDENHLGIYLKWRYSDPCSASMVSVKTTFTISVIHQQRSDKSVTFTSQHQVFSNSQSLLGKSKFVSLKDLLDPSKGYLDGTARQAMIQLRMSECSFGFETIADVSPKNRNRKNTGGVYFDTTTFILSNHRWFLRFYTKKLNSGGLPAAYLYLYGGSQGISLDLDFTLILGDDSTEKLRYDFGEGAKYDGFGKTLSDQFSNPDKLTELNVAVEITRVVAYKLVFLKLPTAQPTTPYISRNLRKSPLIFNKPPLRALSRERVSTPTFNMNDLSQRLFQDHFGNPWKIEFARDSSLETDSSTNLVFEKGVYHYQNNKSKLVCIQTFIMSQNLNEAQDIVMSSPLFVCYFSNSLDEKGYPITFPVSLQQLAEEKFGYSNENGEVLIRIDLMSVQTSSFPVRSGPKFDYLINHQLEKESVHGQDTTDINRSLKDRSASRASLSILDERPPSDGSSSQLLLTPNTGSDGINRSKSPESLLSSGHSDVGVNHTLKSPSVNPFLIEFIQSLSEIRPNEDFIDRTSRDNPKKSETLKGLTISSTFDEDVMMKQARCNVREEIRQKEMSDILVSFLQQKFPVRVSEIVMLGSMGTGTSTTTRCDVDLVIISADLPKENHITWVAPLLKTLRKLLEHASIFEASISSLNCTSFSTTSSSIQFTCDDFLDVDIWVSHDWSSSDCVVKSIDDERIVNTNGKNYHNDRYRSLLEITKRHPNDSRFFEMCSAQLKATLFNELSSQTREYIKIIKNWRNSIIWTKFEYRPNSYLISLLVIKAAQDVNESSLRSVLQSMARYLMEPELRITWDRYYDRETTKKFTFEPPTPLVQDPTNPAINVAHRLKYWGQFKTEYMNWMNILGITNYNN